MQNWKRSKKFVDTKFDMHLSLIEKSKLETIFPSLNLMIFVSKLIRDKIRDRIAFVSDLGVTKTLETELVYPSLF